MELFAEKQENPAPSAVSVPAPLLLKL